MATARQDVLFLFGFTGACPRTGTGAYGPEDLAKAVRYSSEAGIDLLTIDGAGGGTGMSPWRMMNEWGIPRVYLQAMAYKYASIIKKERHMPLFFFIIKT